MEQKNKKWYNFLGIKTKEKKDAEEDIVGPLNLKNFFKLFFRRVGKLLSLNLFMIVEMVPLAAAFLALVWWPAVYTPQSPAMSPLFGVMMASDSPVNSILYGVFGIQEKEPANMSVLFAVWMLLGIIFLLIYGPINVGTTYILRNMVRREPVFMWSDFWYAIKRNLKQGMIYGVIDGILIGLLSFNIYVCYQTLGASFMSDLIFLIEFAIFVVYFFMRFYIYIIMITFDLSIPKIIKNSFIFSIVGFKRNIMALLGIVALLAINFALFMIFGQMNMMFPLILPVFYLLGFGGFMAAYAAYPNIEKYMITPYVKNEEKTEETTEE